MNNQQVAQEILKTAKMLVAGAAEFYKFGPGTDPKKIFRDLVDDARHEKGHGGYSGTIAEKDDFGVISGPLTKNEAYALAERKIDKAEKRGPALAIPIVGTSGEKIIDLKPTKVYGFSAKQAAEDVMEMLTAKFGQKGTVSWVDRPTVTLVKASGWKLTPKGKAAKPEVRFYWKVGYNTSASVATPREAIQGLKAQVAKMVANGEPIKDVAILAGAKQTELITYDFALKNDKGSKFVVTGKVRIAKPSGKVIGYLFFGSAPS